MKSIILMFAVGALTAQTVKAQGTLYISNLGQPSTGSFAAGSDSWLGAVFYTGPDVRGYTLNSIELGMTDASGNPSAFTVMLYVNANNPNAGPFNINSIATLNGSLNPATAGTYTFVPTSNITLMGNVPYTIVLTAGTTVASGAYEWSHTGTYSYDDSDGWSQSGGLWTSSNNGSSWNGPTSGNLQFAINATVVPEPSSEILFGLGGLLFLWHRRKAKSFFV
jgi:hypothetical protein